MTQKSETWNKELEKKLNVYKKKKYFQKGLWMQAV